METGSMNMLKLLKKKFWESVLTDLEAIDVLESATTAENIEVKWRALWRTYKISKDRGSGESSSRFVFLDLMDDLFNTRPTITSSHSRSVGVISERIEPVRAQIPNGVSQLTESDDDDTLNIETDTPSPQPKKRKSNSDKLHEIKMKYYEEKIKSSQEKRKSSEKRTKLLEDYIKNKERSKEERHKEIITAIRNSEY